MRPDDERHISDNQNVLACELKGLAVEEHDIDNRYPVILWDLSGDDVGLWISDEIASGTSITVNIGLPKPLSFDCKVVWCKKRRDGNGHHCGARVLTNKRRVSSLVEHLKLAA